MKRSILVLLCMALGIFVVSSAMAYTPGAGVPGSPHDLSLGHQPSPADPLARICIFCHTPHHAYKLDVSQGGPGPLGSGDIAPADFDYLPLWNHMLLGNPYVGSYSPYYAGPGAPTVGPKATNATLGQPGGTSLLCLSCHDGSIAMNQYGTSSACTSVTGSDFMAGCMVIGLDGILQNHHPIGFNYVNVWGAGLVDDEIRDPNNTAYTLTPPVAGSMISTHLYGTGNTQMECGTCHSVHNTGNTGEILLWRSDASSALCLTCHAKGPYVP